MHAFLAQRKLKSLKSTDNSTHYAITVNISRKLTLVSHNLYNNLLARKVNKFQLLKMSKINLFSCAITILILVAIARCDDEPDVEVHNTFKPEDCPRKAKVSDVLTLHYKGTLQNGEVFDSSYERNEPFSFQLGIGQVIRGWDKGLVDICEGEKRKLVIPPHLAYGDVAHDKIPAKSTLVFEIECLRVEDGPNPVNVFKEIDVDSDGKLSRLEVGNFLKRQLSHAGTEHDPSEQNSMLDEVFKHEDKDKDGYITRDEFSGPKYDHDEL